MTSFTVSGAGLRLTPSRSPATALNRPGKNSATSLCTAASGLLDTTARYMPAAEMACSICVTPSYGAVFWQKLRE